MFSQNLNFLFLAIYNKKYLKNFNNRYVPTTYFVNIISVYVRFLYFV